MLAAPPVAIVVIDPQQRILSWNDAAERMTGYSAAEIIGHPIPDGLQETIAKFAVGFERASKRDIVYGLQSGARRKDGECIVISSSIAGLFDSNGSLKSYIVATEDITQRARAAQAERQVLNRLNAVVDTTADGIVIIDFKGAILMFNPAAERLFGYHAEEALGRNIKMLMPAPYIDEYDRFLQNYRVTGERKIIGTQREVVGRRRDGTTFPMHLFVGEAKEGEDTIFVGVVHDRTKRRAADTALRETEMLLRPRSGR